MSKVNVICLRCGNVQVRTDISKKILNIYEISEDQKICPKCKIKTEQILTNNIQNLRETLEENPSRKLDSYILKLIRR